MGDLLLDGGDGGAGDRRFESGSGEGVLLREADDEGGGVDKRRP